MTSGFFIIISLLKESYKDPGDVNRGPSGNLYLPYFIDSK